MLPYLRIKEKDRFFDTDIKGVSSMFKRMDNQDIQIFFLILFSIGCFVLTAIKIIVDVLGFQEAGRIIEMILSGFNGVVIIALLRSWRSLNQTIKKEEDTYPENNENTDVITPSKKRIKLNISLTLFLTINILSLWLNLS